MACAPRNYVYNRSLKTFHDVYLGLYGSLLFVLYSSGQAATSRALSRLHIAIFSRQEVSRRRVARGSPGENKCS